MHLSQIMSQATLVCPANREPVCLGALIANRLDAIRSRGGESIAEREKLHRVLPVESKISFSVRRSLRRRISTYASNDCSHNGLLRKSVHNATVGRRNNPKHLATAGQYKYE
jgi:hypothetical protein